MKKIFIPALFATFAASFCVGQTVDSKLYRDFAARKSSSILPDFSYVGYHRGEDAIPSPNLKIFDVTAYGAIANDDSSDKQAIVKAIKAAEANGGGIVFFPKGRFLINEDGDDGKTINITGSNIIFRGSGSAPGGTELFMKNPLHPVDTTKMWTTPPMFIFGSKAKKKTMGQVTATAATGDFKIKVNTNSLHPGDWIELAMLSTDPALLKAELGDHQANPAWKSLLKDGIDVHVVHQVKAVNGNEITLYQPLTYNINPADKWTVSVLPCAEEVGIEHIAFVGNWTRKFVHHRSWMDDSGYTLINLRQIVNSWIVDCRFTDVNVGAIVGRGAQVSVLNCSITGNGGHEAITCNGGTNVLLGKIVEEASTWHSVGVAAGSMNTVIWRVKYPSTTSFETHSSQPRNTLLDNVEGGLQYGRGGGAMENMPNHMQGLILWNYKQTNEAVIPFSFWPETVTPWWRVPYPIIVGFHGAKTQFTRSELKYEESTGQAVEPGSLYEAQLKLRLGKLPDWLKQLK